MNRQTDHWYFRLVADSGTRVRMIIAKMQPDTYNGVEATDWWNFNRGISCYLSYDGKDWKPMRTNTLPGHELYLDFTLLHENVYVARLPVYTISDLEDMLYRYRHDELFKVIRIGETVEGRPLEIIRLGKNDARYSFIIRARAHPWEPGGSWVVQGLIRKFLGARSADWINTFNVYIMPMANKDGVARGMTRFNTKGMDLNRKWDTMSDSILCPEKYALEKFLENLGKKGVRPVLGIDIHNDDAGSIITATHERGDARFLKNMKLLEELMRKYTIFTEAVRYSWKDPDKNDNLTMFEDGLYKRYGIEAIVWELNANWNGKDGRMPLSDDWMESGGNLNDVFFHYARSLAD